MTLQPCSSLTDLADMRAQGMQVRKRSGDCGVRKSGREGGLAAAPLDPLAEGHRAHTHTLPGERATGSGPFGPGLSRYKISPSWKCPRVWPDGETGTKTGEAPEARSQLKPHHSGSQRPGLVSQPCYCLLGTSQSAVR